MNWTELSSVFVLGLAGTGHCISMCGAFSLMVSAGAASAGASVWRQVSYQLGKATSYVFIGVLLLLAGGWIDARWPMLRFQTVLGWVVGAAMIVAGVAYTFELRLPATLGRWWQGSAACGALGAIWRSPSLLRALLIGWVNGFLPCGLSLMALTMLASTGSVATVATGAYGFGLATLPGLLLVGLAGQRLGVSQRRWLVRLGGVALIVLGVLTLVRGMPAVHGWLHGHLIPSGGGHSGHHGH